jgi:hypothetical protein
MSVNPVVSEHDEKDKILKFLKDKGASIPNFLLADTDDNEDKWKEKYPTYPTPLIILIDRQGKRSVIREPSSAEVEAQVEKLLAAK